MRTCCTSSGIFKTLPEHFASWASVTEVVLDARIKRSYQRSVWIRIAQLKVEMVMEKKATPQMETDESLQRWPWNERRGETPCCWTFFFPSKNIFLWIKKSGPSLCDRYLFPQNMERVEQTVSGIAHQSKIALRSGKMHCTRLSLNK